MERDKDEKNELEIVPHVPSRTKINILSNYEH